MCVHFCARVFWLHGGSGIGERAMDGVLCVLWEGLHADSSAIICEGVLVSEWDRVDLHM